MSLVTLNMNYDTDIMFYNTPFQLLDSLSQLPFGSNVYVISDTEYKEYKQKQAAQEIEVLEERAKSYEKTAMSIRKTTLELKQEAGLLPKAEDERTT